VTNGRMLSRELMEGVKAHGEILLTYEYVKPGQETPIRKIGYAVAIPAFNVYLGTGAYLDDLDTKLKPVIWALGLATLIIAVLSGGIAWMIGRSKVHNAALIACARKLLIYANTVVQRGTPWTEKAA
jgi:methyl-accepting chemotaxis protein